MITAAFLIHALTPLHSGVGDSTDVVDLPIARMKSTGFPFVPGTSIKGVLRDAERESSSAEKITAAFGPPSSVAGDHAGALVVGDARLLALPVQSFRGTFAWCTSPLLLFLARRDLGSVPSEDRDSRLPIPQLDGLGACVVENSACIQAGRVYLDEIDLDATSSAAVGHWAVLLAPMVSPDDDIFTKRFVVVDDDTMAFLCKTATQIDARVRIDEETRTVAKGALWLEESLPPETLLVGLAAADRSRGSFKMTPAEVLDYGFPPERIVQLGGKASTGRGRCRLMRLGR